MPETEGITCPECNSELEEKKGPRGQVRYYCPVCKKIRSGGKGSQAVKSTTDGNIEFFDDGETYALIGAWIPSRFLTLFEYARDAEISDHPDIVTFLCEYAEYGFIKSHNLGLSLAPMNQQDGGSAKLDSLEKEVEGLKQVIREYFSGRAEEVTRATEE